MMEKIKSQNAELKMLEQEAEVVEQRRNTAEKLEAAARKMVEERVIIVKNLTLLKDKIIEDLKLTRSVYQSIITEDADLFGISGCLLMLRCWKANC